MKKTYNRNHASIKKPTTNNNSAYNTPQEVDESKNILPEDHTLKAELFSESAIEYVISLAVAGLKTALDRGRFIIPEAAKDALEEIDRENNSATAFYNDMLDDRGKEIKPILF